MRRAALILSTLVFVLFMAGCGSQSSTSSNPVVTNPQTVPVSMTVTDTPPKNVTVLFFQLNITGAVLSPGSVSLLPSTNPIPVNVTQLQTESAFLGSQNVTAGTYTSLSLTFSNPQLTIFNGSGATIGTGANACANNSVCQLAPTVDGSLMLTFSTAPFPVTVATNSPLAFKLDIHLDTVIQSDLSINLAATNGVTISQLQAPSGSTTVTPLGKLTGTIQSVNSSTTPNSFTLQTGDGRSFTIDVNSSTTYNYPTAVCSTDTFACLATQQIVKVAVSLQTGGTLLASSVAYVQPASQLVVEGNILRVNTSNGNTILDMILQKGPPPPASAAGLVPIGQRATVSVPPGSAVTYAIDAGTFVIPNGLTFASISDLLAGQTVRIVVAPGTVTAPTGAGSPISITSPAATTFTASSITLETSQITGTVAALNTGNLSLTLSTLPNYFVPPTAVASTSPPIPAPVNITVDTTSATTFLPLTLTPDTFLGLKVNDVVSVQGWVFSTPLTNPAITLAAEGVLDRGSITPLF
jgi:hypothetical protein